VGSTVPDGGEETEPASSRRAPGEGAVSVPPSPPEFRAADLVVLGLAVSTFGAAFGATAVSLGFDPLKVIVLSVAAHAGTAQLAAIAILTAGGSTIAAFTAGMLITARFIPLGLMLTRRFPPSIRTRLLATHLMTEPSGALAITARTDAEGRRLYWRVGGTMLIVWILGSVLGALGGHLVSDIRSFGLDAALPALLAGVLAPMLRDRIMRYAALVSAGVAIGLHTVLPVGPPIILAAASGFVVARLLRGGLPTPVAGADDGSDSE